MLFSQHDYVIQTFAPHGTHQSLGKRTLPRTLGRDLHFCYSHPLDSLVEILPIDLVSISKQVTRCRIVRKRFDDLLSGPEGRRVLCHMEVNQASAVMSKHHQDK